MNRPRTRLIRAAVSAGVILVAGVCNARQANDAPARPLIRDVQVKAGLPVFRLDRSALSAARGATGAVFTLAGFPLPAASAQRVDLELAEFKVTSEGTRYAVGRRGENDRPVEFDPDSFTFLRGTVRGFAGSHVFMALSDRLSTARIDLGPGHPRFLLSNRGGGRVELAPGELVVFPSVEGSIPLSGIPMCAVPPASLTQQPPRPVDPAAGMPPLPMGPRGVTFRRGLQQIELAVETDYELFELFGDLEDAAAYVTAMYAAVSDIYIRDVNSRVVLTYVRLWDTPDDLFNTPDDPLGEFVQYWNQHMQLVPRDVAQFFSGRRNLSAGGVAFANALCNNASYSWVGYALGFFSDPDTPHWAHRDVHVAAHELGHNCGTLHTHDYNLDDCDNENSQPRRGSIMSYCGQTYSGGDANHDLWFHEFTARLMREYIYSRGCVADDCNANNIPDVLDIMSGVLHDLNGNAVPDECEDCNANGILDPEEIAAGMVADVNANGVPDPCELDCNANNIPDSTEIAATPSLDLNANRVLDECEADRNDNGTADYNEIQADMSLDINRNAVLDSTEDCDADGTPDLVELDHAWNVYVGSAEANAPLHEYHAQSGVQMNLLAGEQGSDVQDVIVTRNRRVLVSRGGDNRIDEFAADGSFVRTLVQPGAGGLSFPAQMLVSRSSPPTPPTLLVASLNTNRVLEFDLQTGDFLRVLVGDSSTAPPAPFGLAFGPNGNLFVTSRSHHTVSEFDPSTGSFVRVFVAAGANGGLLQPHGLVFKPDGNLLVCSWGTNAILEYDGATGAFLRQWSRVGTATRLTFENPWCIRLGPDGDIYATRSDTHTFAPNPPGLHLTNARIYHFDVRNGNFVRAYLLGVDSDLHQPTGFDFMPGLATDCNQNRVPDECDIASGTSLDCDANGVPDDCDIRAGAPDVNRDGIPDQCQCLPDWNMSGTLNSQDFFDFLGDFFKNRADFNGSGSTDSQDFFDFLTAFFAGCD